MSPGGIWWEETTSNEPPAPAPFDWAAVDLRPGTPFGDLFLALFEFAQESGAFPKPPGRKPFEGKKFYEDYKLASARWPDVKKPKQLAKLMREHSRKVFAGRYDHITADAIRKRIDKLLTALKTLKPITEEEFRQFQARRDDPNFFAITCTRAVKATLTAKRRGNRGK